MLREIVLALDAGYLGQALRSTVLEIAFDGNRTVWCPVGDFFGTGTEDYYGYAWCRPEFFESPFHAQPSGRGNNKAEMSVNSRYRLLDGIPFTNGIRFDMELWHWKKTPVNYAPATFWYALPGATCNVDPDPESSSLPVPKSVEDINPAAIIKGAIEAESLKITKKTNGSTTG